MPLIREESHPFFPFGFALTQQVVDALNVKTILPETGNRAVRRNVLPSVSWHRESMTIPPAFSPRGVMPPAGS